MLATMSLGFVMSPASAAPDTAQNIDAVTGPGRQALREGRDRRPASRQGGREARRRPARSCARRLPSIRRHERLIEALRAQVAGYGRRQLRRHRRLGRPRSTCRPCSTRRRRRTRRRCCQRGPRQRGRRCRGRCPGAVQRRSSRTLTQRKTALQGKLDLLARGEEATRSMERVGRHPPGEGRRHAGRPRGQADRRDGRTRRRLREVEGRQLLRLRRCRAELFDCSGLTMAAWSQAGVSLPHSSSAQYSSGRHISESELQPGDLVFYYSPISHVGMYIGNGQIVNALNPGAGVRDLRTARHAVRRCRPPWADRTQPSRSPFRGGRLRACSWSWLACSRADRRATTTSTSRPRGVEGPPGQHAEGARRRWTRWSTRSRAGRGHDAVALAADGLQGPAGLGLRQRRRPAGRRPLAAVRRRGSAARPGQQTSSAGCLERHRRADLPLRRVRRDAGPDGDERRLRADGRGVRIASFGGGDGARRCGWPTASPSYARRGRCWPWPRSAGPLPGAWSPGAVQQVVPGAARLEGAVVVEVPGHACRARCRARGAAGAVRQHRGRDDERGRSLAPGAPVRVFVNPAGLRQAQGARRAGGDEPRDHPRGRRTRPSPRCRPGCSRASPTSWPSTAPASRSISRRARSWPASARTACPGAAVDRRSRPDGQRARRDLRGGVAGLPLPRPRVRRQGAGAVLPRGQRRRHDPGGLPQRARHLAAEFVARWRADLARLAGVAG